MKIIIECECGNKGILKSDTCKNSINDDKFQLDENYDGYSTIECKKCKNYINIRG